jgi:cytoskeletal protein RodZ
VFEIGSTLREARVRRKLTLQQAEEDTKIRVKYLQAMENEDFDLMPGRAYVKGFLQTYAQYLGLDPAIILDEYRSRGTPREEQQPFGGSSVIGKPHSHRGRNTLAFIAVAGLLVLAVIYVLGLSSEGADQSGGPGIDAGLLSPSPSPSASPSKSPSPKASASAVARDVVRVSASDGDCWLEVRRGDAAGEVLYRDTLTRGKTKVFHGDALFMTVGNPPAISIRAGEKLLPRLEGVGPLDISVVDGKLLQGSATEG